MAASFDIDVPRNGSYLRRWTLTNSVGEPIDLKDHIIELRVSAFAGGPLLAPGRISARDDEAGAFNVEIRGSDYESVEGTSEIVRLNFNFIVTNPDDVAFVIARGQPVLFPGA